MVGVAVSVEHGDQLEVEFAEQREVPRMLLEHRVDEDGLSRARVAQQYVYVDDAVSNS